MNCRAGRIVRLMQVRPCLIMACLFNTTVLALLINIGASLF